MDHRRARKQCIDLALERFHSDQIDVQISSQLQLQHKTTWHRHGFAANPLCPVAVARGRCRYKNKPRPETDELPLPLPLRAPGAPLSRVARPAQGPPFPSASASSNRPAGLPASQAILPLPAYIYAPLPPLPVSHTAPGLPGSACSAPRPPTPPPPPLDPFSYRRTGSASARE
jgi:hypothetical protein